MRCIRVIWVLACLGGATGAGPALSEPPAAPEHGAATSLRDPALVAIGERWHARFVDEMGGEYHNPALLDYVSGVAARITAVSVQATEPWQVVLLNTPYVNAWARPGGYIYITRGMLAVMGDEDELAAIIAHEVSHVAERHFARERDAAPDTSGARVLGDLLSSWLSPERQSRDVFAEMEAERVDFLAFSRAQELEADIQGVALLAAAGYDPLAMSDALAAMFDWNGVEYGDFGYFDWNLEPDPDSDYPTDSERVAATRALGYANLADKAAPERLRDPYLAAIQGLAFGDSARALELDGQRLLLNQVGLSLEFPEVFTIQTGPSTALILGPDRLRMRIDAVADDGSNLRDYVTRVWMPEQRETYPGQRFRVLSAYGATEQGYDIGFANVQLESETGIRRKLRPMVLRHDGWLIRITTEQRTPELIGSFPQQSWESWFAQPFPRIAPISPEEAAARRGLTLHLVTVKPADTVASLMADAREAYQVVETFARLNRLRPLILPPPGSLVRILSR